MTPTDLLHQKITVLGAARSGCAAARLLAGNGGRVFVSDNGAPNDDALRKLKDAGIPHEFGAHSEAIFDCDVMVLSPGISPDSAPVQDARKRGVRIIGELELAFLFHNGPVIAITGSNGKSTTTAWLGWMFQQARENAMVCGNIGLPFSEAVLNREKNATAIVEVSSFQLQTVEQFRPNIGVLLNLHPDHLERHGSFAAYAATKLALFKNQTKTDVAIWNAEDTESARAFRCGCVTATHLPCDTRQELQTGCFVSGGTIVYKHNKLMNLLPVTELALPGKHNFTNALAATCAACAAGLPATAIRQALRTFSGLEHRLEFVRELRGVTYVNDSKATNTHAMQQAIASYNRPLLLVAGGKDKGEDFSTICPLISKNARHCLLMGETAELIDKSLSCGTPRTRVSCIEEAVLAAARLAQTGDVVLLAPGSSSFDMFRDFEDRGRQFKEAVHALR